MEITSNITLFSSITILYKKVAPIGVIACNVLRREIEIALQDCPEAVEAVFLSQSLTARPHELKEAVLAAIEAMKDKVTGIFLGYADCKSLGGIEDQFDIPMVHPKNRDCVTLLLGEERYRAEMSKETGTWFMTPGWTGLTPELMIPVMGFDKFKDSGVTPKEFMEMMFESYNRGLYIDTGVDDTDECEKRAGEICEYLGLKLETTSVKSNALTDGLKECVRLAALKVQED